MSHRASVFGGVLVVLLSGLNSPTQAAYYVTDLGSLGGQSSPININNSGQIAGYAWYWGAYHAVLLTFNGKLSC